MTERDPPSEAQDPPSRAGGRLVARAAVIALLSEEEVARYCATGRAVHLEEGEEYLDLGQLDRGVRRANGATTPMGETLPKRGISKDTWAKILAALREQPR